MADDTIARLHALRAYNAAKVAEIDALLEGIYDALQRPSDRRVYRYPRVVRGYSDERMGCAAQCAFETHPNES